MQGLFIDYPMITVKNDKDRIATEQNVNCSSYPHCKKSFLTTLLPQINDFFRDLMLTSIQDREEMRHEFGDQRKGVR